MIWDGPTIHPTCQPVAEKVLPAEDMVRVRSYMFGREAKWMCPGHVDGGRFCCGFDDDEGDDNDADDECEDDDDKEEDDSDCNFKFRSII